MFRQLRAYSILALVTGIAGNALAEGQDLVEPRSFQNKSTLETFALQSLDTEDLADAVISGALDAPAAGEETEAPDRLRESNAESTEELLKNEFATAPRLQPSLPEPRLPMVTHKQSNYDVLNINPR